MKITYSKTQRGPKILRLQLNRGSDVDALTGSKACLQVTIGNSISCHRKEPDFGIDISPWGDANERSEKLLHVA